MRGFGKHPGAPQDKSSSHDNRVESNLEIDRSPEHRRHQWLLSIENREGWLAAEDRGMSRSRKVVWLSCDFRYDRFGPAALRDFELHSIQKERMVDPSILSTYIVFRNTV